MCAHLLTIQNTGKILRKTMRKLTEDVNVPIPATIDDASALDELKEIYKKEQIGPIYASGKKE